MHREKRIAASESAVQWCAKLGLYAFLIFPIQTNFFFFPDIKHHLVGMEKSSTGQWVLVTNSFLPLMDRVPLASSNSLAHWISPLCKVNCGVRWSQDNTGCAAPRAFTLWHCLGIEVDRLLILGAQMRKQKQRWPVACLRACACWWCSWGRHWTWAARLQHCLLKPLPWIVRMQRSKGQ